MAMSCSGCAGWVGWWVLLVGLLRPVFGLPFLWLMRLMLSYLRWFAPWSMWRLIVRIFFGLKAILVINALQKKMVWQIVFRSLLFQIRWMNGLFIFPWIAFLLMLMIYREIWRIFKWLFFAFWRFGYFLYSFFSMLVFPFEILLHEILMRLEA